MSRFLLILHAKNNKSRPMFHAIIQKITLAQFLRHGSGLVGKNGNCWNGSWI